MRPSDFTYDELKRLLMAVGYIEDTKGKTSGSRVSFYNETTKDIIGIHKPHPGNILKGYVVKEICDKLTNIGVI